MKDWNQDIKIEGLKVLVKKADLFELFDMREGICACLGSSKMNPLLEIIDKEIEGRELPAQGKAIYRTILE